MSRKSSIFIFIFFVLANLTATAQTDAKAIMDKMAQTYRQWDGMRATFTALISSEMGGAAESFEGTIVMKGEKFVLATPDMITWFDGVTQWSYMPRNDEVNVITPSRADLRFINPMMMLNDYAKDFKASYIGESTSVNARNACDVALVPKKQEEIERIEIQIEKATSLPALLIVKMRNNLRSAITINSIERMATTDAMFAFPADEYPDAEIIDLR